MDGTPREPAPSIFSWCTVKESTVYWKSGMTVDDDPLLLIFDRSDIRPPGYETNHDPKQQQQPK